MHDLSGSDPERTRTMAEKWEAWARRDDVLPWPWKPPYSLQRTMPGEHAEPEVFELKQGDDLQGERAPAIGGQVDRDPGEDHEICWGRGDHRPGRSG